MGNNREKWNITKKFMRCRRTFLLNKEILKNIVKTNKIWRGESTKIYCYG